MSYQLEIYGLGGSFPNPTLLHDYGAGHANLIYQTLNIDLQAFDKEFKPSQSSVKLDVLFDTNLYLAIMDAGKLPAILKEDGVTIFTGYANFDTSIQFSNAVEVIALELVDKSLYLDQAIDAAINIDPDVLTYIYHAGAPSVSILHLLTSGLTTQGPFAGVTIANPPGTPVSADYGLHVPKGTSRLKALTDILRGHGWTFYFNSSGQLVLFNWGASLAGATSTHTFSDLNGEILDNTFRAEKAGDGSDSLADGVVVKYKQFKWIRDHNIANFLSYSPGLAVAPLSTAYEPKSESAKLYGASIEYFAPSISVSKGKILKRAATWLGTKSFIGGYSGDALYPVLCIRGTNATGKYTISGSPNPNGRMKTLFPGSEDPFSSVLVVESEDLSMFQLTATIRNQSGRTVAYQGFFGAVNVASQWCILQSLALYADLFIEADAEPFVSQGATKSAKSVEAPYIYTIGAAQRYADLLKSCVLPANHIFRFSSYVSVPIGAVITAEITKNNLTYKGIVATKRYDKRTKEYHYQVLLTKDVALYDPTAPSFTDGQLPEPTDAPLGLIVGPDGLLTVPLTEDNLSEPPEAGYTSSGLKFDKRQFGFFDYENGWVVRIQDNGDAFFRGTIEAGDGHIGGALITESSLVFGDDVAILNADGSALIGGWHFTAENRLRSQLSGSRIDLNPDANRVEIWAAAGSEPKVAMGYLGGLSNPANRANQLSSNIFGFWTGVGDVLQINGNMGLGAGSFQLDADAVLDIVDGDSDLLLRLGAVMGQSGMHFYEYVAGASNNTRTAAFLPRDGIEIQPGFSVRPLSSVDPVSGDRMLRVEHDTLSLSVFTGRSWVNRFEVGLKESNAGTLADLKITGAILKSDTVFEQDKFLEDF